MDGIERAAWTVALVFSMIAGACAWQQVAASRCDCEPPPPACVKTSGPWERYQTATP